MTKPPTKPRKPSTPKKASAAAAANTISGPDPALVVAAENRAKEYLSLAVAAERLKQWDEAIKYCRLILRINPVDPESRYLAPYCMAHVLYQMGRTEESAGYAHAAVAANRDRHQAYNLLGNIYRRLGMFEDAVWYLLAGISRATNNKKAWINLQTFLNEHPELLANMPNLADTVEAARKLLESRGQLPRSH